MPSSSDENATYKDTTFADGSYTKYRNDDITCHTNSGYDVRRNNNGSVSIECPDGLLLNVDSDGNITLHEADGGEVTVSDDGVSIHENDGSMLSCSDAGDALRSNNVGHSIKAESVNQAWNEPKYVFCSQSYKWHYSEGLKPNDGCHWV